MNALHVAMRARPEYCAPQAVLGCLLYVSKLPVAQYGLLAPLVVAVTGLWRHQWDERDEYAESVGAATFPSKHVA